MRAATTIAAISSMASVASAATGFNYASTNGDGSGKTQADFEASFKAAAALPGTDGKFTSARLYTMIQGGTSSDPISAIPAAISTGTTLLLGLWASAGSTAFDLELKALKAAIDTYGDKLKDVVVGISIGSEDLYRITPTSQASSPNPGAEPSTIAEYIQKTRDLLKGTALESAKLGHVDTWTSWTNSSNSAVIDAVDWVGFDGYPYFQNGDDNDVENGKNLFDESVDKTKAAVGGKPVWITETGWPVSGSTYNKAVANVDNAERYWQTVGCPLFDVENVWWYILADSGSNPEFGIVQSLDSAPYYNLTCEASATSSSSSASASATGSGSSATGTSGTTLSGSSQDSTANTPVVPTSNAGGPVATASGAGSAVTFASGYAPTTLAPDVATGSYSNSSPFSTGSSDSSSGSSSSSSDSAGSSSAGHHGNSTSGSNSASAGIFKNSTGSASSTGSSGSTSASTIATSNAGRLASFSITVITLAAAVAMI